MNDFDSFLNDYLEFTNPEVWKHKFDQYATHQRDFLDADMNTEGYKLIHLKFQDSENGEFVETTIFYDEYLHSKAAYYFEHPSTRITSEISDIEQLNKFLNMLRTSLTQIKDHQKFFDNYPLYVSAIIKLGKTLKKIHEIFDKPLKANKTAVEKTGEKTSKAVELKPCLNMIISAGDHETAITALEKKYQDFAWNDPHKKLFKDNGKLNKSQVSKALEIVGKIMWGDKAPGDENIRTILLK